MADAQVPWGVAALNGSVNEPAWKTKPNWYLVATDDRMIPPTAHDSRFHELTQLFLNDGKWQGRQIVSREWARKSSAPLRQLNEVQTYGYLWNSVEYPYRGRKLHAYFPGGNGGQVYIGIPDLDLLIAFTGGNYADRVLFRAQRNFVPEDILPVVRQHTDR